MTQRIPKILRRLWPVVVLAACDGGSGVSKDAGSARSDAGVIEARSAPTPCDWVPASEVEEILGKFAGRPRIGLSANTLHVDPDGAACVYSLLHDTGALEIALEVDLTGGQAEEQGMGMGLDHVFRVADEHGIDGESGEMLDALVSGLTAAPGGAAATERGAPSWDYAGGLPGFALWRVGHVAVKIGGDTLLVPGDSLERLALRVREEVAHDLPYALAGERLAVSSRGSDPCALLTRAEAEAVLGELVAEPYRSLEDSPLAAGAGPSCSYLTKGRRALVLTPEYSDGRMLYNMIAGFGGLMRSNIGGADAGDLLDGPWDEATAGADGMLYFLKGDRMLKLVHGTSSTDLAGAAKLAESAVPRL